MSIKLSNENITVFLDGRIKPTPTKRGYKSSESIYGEELNESTRGVINLVITIEQIKEEEYQKLVDLFFDFDTNIDIEDRDRGKVFKNYYITGDKLDLTEKEDLVNKSYYYIGNLSMNRR